MGWSICGKEQKRQQLILTRSKDRWPYNSHDLGEFGKMIRLEYVYNIFDDVKWNNLSSPRSRVIVVPKTVVALYD